MSMTEMTEHISGQDFSKMMNPPLPHDGKSYISYGKDNKAYVSCGHCGKKQFPIEKNTVIRNLPWRCKSSKCKRIFTVNVE